MVVDYDILSSVLMGRLKKKYATNYMTVEDVIDTLDELRPQLSKAPDMSQTIKDKIDSLSEEQLLVEIKECFEHVSDKWDRDNLMLLRYMCKRYEIESGCSKFAYYSRLYDKERCVVTGCMNGCDYDMYSCFMSILSDKENKRYFVIYSAIVSKSYVSGNCGYGNKKYKVAYRSNPKCIADEIDADIFQNVSAETDVDIINAIA